MARSSNILAKNSGSLRRSMKGGGGGIGPTTRHPPAQVLPLESVGASISGFNWHLADVLQSRLVLLFAIPTEGGGNLYSSQASAGNLRQVGVRGADPLQSLLAHVEHSADLRVRQRLLGKGSDDDPVHLARPLPPPP
jgi:hypothetical protein